MNGCDEASEDRIPRPCAVLARTTASLDPGTVLREIVEGAADYIVKPFSTVELTTRVGAEPFVLGELAIDCERRLVSIGGRPVEMTATGYELLRRVWTRRYDASAASATGCRS